MTDREQEQNQQEMTFIVKPSMVDEGNYIAAPLCPGTSFGRGRTRIDALEDCVRSMNDD